MRGCAERVQQRPTGLLPYFAAVTLLLSGVSRRAWAGDMDAYGYVLFASLGYCVLIVIASAVAFWICRRIADVRLRALARWSMLVLLYTPVPCAGLGLFGMLPAFLAVFAHPYSASEGPQSHPFALAYGVVCVLTLPLLIWRTSINEHRN